MIYTINFRVNLRIPKSWTDDYCYTEGHIKEHQPFQIRVNCSKKHFHEILFNINYHYLYIFHRTLMF